MIHLIQFVHIASDLEGSVNRRYCSWVNRRRSLLIKNELLKHTIMSEGSLLEECQSSTVNFLYSVDQLFHKESLYSNNGRTKVINIFEEIFC